MKTETFAGFCGVPPRPRLDLKSYGQGCNFILYSFSRPFQGKEKSEMDEKTRRRRVPFLFLIAHLKKRKKKKVKAGGLEEGRNLALIDSDSRSHRASQLVPPQRTSIRLLSYPSILIFSFILLKIKISHLTKMYCTCSEFRCDPPSLFTAYANT